MMGTVALQRWIWLVLFLPASGQPPPAEVVEIRRLGDKATYNAFTALTRFRERWYLAFREAGGPNAQDGVIRVLSSADGERWAEAARLSIEGADLRDPKLSVSPRQTLTLSAVAAYPGGSPAHHQSMLFFTTEGREWSKPVPAGDPNIRMWGVYWSPRQQAFSIGYSSWGPPLIRLYASPDGIKWKTLADELLTDNFPNESAIWFDSGDTAHCLLRRDKGPATALLGTSRPPYRAWQWRDTGVRIVGPSVLRLADGRLLAALGLLEGKPRVALSWLDTQEAKLTEFLTLPSGGDCGYPGAVWHDDLLWVSYHSSHEGKTAVYLAKVRIRPAREGSPQTKPWMRKPLDR
jgi:hypothetical protein